MKTKLIAFLVLLCTTQNSDAQIFKKIMSKNDNDTSKIEKTEKKAGGSLFQKAITKIAKVAGNTVAGASGMVKTVDNLNEVDVRAALGVNIYSKNLGLTLNDFLSDEWYDYGDFTMLGLSSKNGMTYYKYAGTVSVNKKPLKHSSFGFYAICESATNDNKTITFEKNGQIEGEFQIPKPTHKVKLVSINGAKDNITIDFTKDVTLEIADFEALETSLIRIDVVYSVIGMRTQALVAYVKPTSKITIPYQAFRNLETKNKGLNFKDSYLSISQQELVKSINNKGIFTSPINVLTGSNDGKWINVSNKGEHFYGIKFEKEIGEAKIDVEKDNAAYAMPLSFAKKVAVASFSIEGITQMSSTKINRFQQTETKKSIDFPQIPDSWQDATLADLYGKLTNVFTSITTYTLFPENTVTNLKSYENVQQFFLEDTNEKSNFLRAYKGLNPIKALSSPSVILNGENALLAESKTDALLKVKMQLDLTYDEKPLMTPYLIVELDGKTNGDFRSYLGNTKYFRIKIIGKPYEIKRGKSLTPAEYAKITQIDTFTESFKHALSELKEKEIAIGDYEIVWNLQK